MRRRPRRERVRTATSGSGARPGRWQDEGSSRLNSGLSPIRRFQREGGGWQRGEISTRDAAITSHCSPAEQGSPDFCDVDLRIHTHAHILERRSVRRGKSRLDFITAHYRFRERGSKSGECAFRRGACGSLAKLLEIEE